MPVTSSRRRTNAVICLAKQFPAVFDPIETYDPEDVSKLAEVDPPFAKIFNKPVRWWTLKEPPGNMSVAELQQLKKFSSDLVEAMGTNKRTAMSTQWPQNIKSHLQEWGQAARAWDKDVERVLKDLDLTVKTMWFRAAPSERGDSAGMPQARVWDPHHAKIVRELFPELPGVETPTGNIADELKTWLVVWLTDYIHTSRKIKERMGKSLNITDIAIQKILGPEFWQTHVLNISGLKMPDIIALNRLLTKWTDQIEWTITLADEEDRLKKQLGPDPSPDQIKDRWVTLSDSAKKVEWAGYAYGQTEAIINGIRKPGNVLKEIELDLLVSDTLKTAILHGRKLGKNMKVTTGANIRTATEEEIAEFDNSLTENLEMWGQGDTQAPWEAVRTLWTSENDLDDDADNDWRQDLFLMGTDLGVETEKTLDDAQLCDLLGWSPETGIPAAFRTHVHEDPAMPPVEPVEDGSPVSKGVKRVQLHWHQKAGVSAMLRKTTEPPKERISRAPSGQNSALACTALKEGWADSPGVLLADGVGTGKTLQILSLIATLIQLREYQMKNVETPRSNWPGALRFYKSFCGLEGGIPDASHLVLVPLSILPQFVQEAKRFFRGSAVDIFHIESGQVTWKTTWNAFDNSHQPMIRKIVFISHPTLVRLMKEYQIEYINNKVVFKSWKAVRPKTEQPFNRPWVSASVDEVHDARTGGKLYQAIQAIFETALIRVVATATPIYQNLRDIYYIAALLHSQKIGPKEQSQILALLSDLTRLRNKTRKDDVEKLTISFDNQGLDEDSMAQTPGHKFAKLITGVMKGLMADRIIRRTSHSKRHDGALIGKDLPPCTEVHVNVTLSKLELEAAQNALEKTNIAEAMKENAKQSFFLPARKEAAFFGAADLQTRELSTREFADLDALNKATCTKLKCMIRLVQIILTKGAATLFADPEIGKEGLVKSDSEMGVRISDNQKLDVITNTHGPDRKLIIHTEFTFLQGLIASALRVTGIKSITVSGATGTAKMRASELERFRSSPDIPVLLISNVVATGLNIAYCSVMILYDAGWSKIHTIQIAGRIHRQGQRQQTYLFQMASDQTIDTLLLANGRNKGQLLKSFLSVERNKTVWKNLNNTADAEEIWEYLEEESGLSHPDVQDLRASGMIKSDILPGKDVSSLAKPKVRAPKKIKRKAALDEESVTKGETSTGGRRKKSRLDLNPQLDVSASNTSSDTTTDESSRANTDSEMDLDFDDFDPPPSRNLSLPASAHSLSSGAPALGYHLVNSSLPPAAASFTSTSNLRAETVVDLTDEDHEMPLAKAHRSDSDEDLLPSRLKPFGLGNDSRRRASNVESSLADPPKSRPTQRRELLADRGRGRNISILSSGSGSKPGKEKASSSVARSRAQGSGSGSA